MASTYSTNLALELIGTGDQSGTWGTTNNTNLGTLIEQAISGYQTQVITDGADTVITIPNGASGVARNMTLELTGALTAARNLIVPANKKLYFIYNNTTGGYAVTVKVSGQTGVSVPNGVKTLLVSNGTDVVSAVTYLANLTVGGNPTLSGGTANGVAYLNASKVLTTGSGFTYSSTGNLVVAAPSSGTALQVTGLTGSVNAARFTDGANYAVLIKQKGASTAFVGAEAGFGFAIGANDASNIAINTTGNVTINAPASGIALTATAVGTSGAIKAVATTAGSNSFIASPGSATGVAYSFDTNGTVGMYQSAVNNIDFGVLGSSAININSTRNVTINAPSSGNTLTVTPLAGGNIGVDVNGNIGAGTAIRLFNTSATDGRSTIEFRSDLTSSKQWAIGLDAAGGTSKSFDFRDLTRSAIPLSIASAGNVTINAPASGDALTVNGNIALGAAGNITGWSTGAAYTLGANPNATVTSGGFVQFFGSTNGTPSLVNIGTNNATRIQTNATGNVTIFAPGSGTALSVSSGSLPGSAITVYTSGDITTNGPSSYLRFNYNNNVNSGGYIGYGGFANQLEIYNYLNGPISFITNSIERAKIDGSGTLLVGAQTNTESSKVLAAAAKTISVGIPTNQLAVYDTTAMAAGVGGAINFIGNYTSGGASTSFASIEASKDNATSGNFGAAMVFKTRVNGGSQTEAMRIDSSQNLLVGTTSNFGSNVRSYIVATTGGNAQITSTDTSAAFVEAVWNRGTTGNNNFTEFGTEGTYTARGSITYNRGGGLVAYNTTSDYRAKDIIGPVQNPGATIDALKVYEGVMKGATQSRPMLIAHEAQAVAPYAVSGVKDEVNEDGTPKFQQMDVSSLVPLLIAEIQSLRQRLAVLEGKQ